MRIQLLAAVLGVIAGPGAAAAPAGPAMLVLFGAGWCAPCRAELGDAAALAALMRPGQVTLAWLDRNPVVEPLPPGLAIADRTEVARLLRLLPADAAGVPYALLLDRTGAVCARYPGRVDPRVLAVLRRQCG